MVVKKKFGIKTVVLLVLLLLNLFAFCTISYASTPTIEELTKFVDAIKIKQSSGELNNSSYTVITGNSSFIAEELYNSTQDVDYTIDNLIYISGRSYNYGTQGQTTSINGCFVIANNTFSDTLNYLGLKYVSNYMLYCYEMSDRNTILNNIPIYTIPVGTSDINKVTDYNYIGSYNMTNKIFNFNTQNFILTNNMIFSTKKTASVYWYNDSDREYYPALNNYSGSTFYEIYPEEDPDEPIVWPSGEGTAPDLSGIASGIDNLNNSIIGTGQNIVNNQNQNTDKVIQNQDKNTQDIKDTLTNIPDLSGEKITSGEITEALNFEFAEDPYANFWLELTTGLSGALTDNVRSIDIQFRGETYKIELDKFSTQMPLILKSFLTILSTVFIFWKMIKYWKIIIDNITSGNMDEVLEMNEEERYYRFILERR